MMDKESLRLILSGHHMNMEERFQRGLWPSQPLAFETVVATLVELLEEQIWFPHERTADSIEEGGVIERCGARFIYRSQVAHPLRPGLITRRVERTFYSADEAAREYLKWDLNLPGDLDGWKVI